MNRDQHTAFAAIVKDAAHRFERKVGEWNWHFPGYARRQAELYKEAGVPALEAAVEKAEKAVSAARAKQHAAERPADRQLDAERERYLAEKRLSFATALCRLAGSDNAEQAEAIVRELL